MKPLPQTATFMILGVIAVVFLCVHTRFDGLVQMKVGLDGGEVIIDGRQSKGEAPPSLE